MVFLIISLEVNFILRYDVYFSFIDVDILLENIFLFIDHDESFKEFYFLIKNLFLIVEHLEVFVFY